jgi:hypothetical protein
MKKGYRILIIFLIVFLILSGFIFVIQKVRGATNIVSSPTTNRWAWNDIIGWIDSFSTNRTWVTSAEIQGYASSTAIGDIAFNCDPNTGDPPGSTGAPAGSNCSINYKVSNDGGGNLSGWAWSDTIGWISFCGNSSGGSTWNGSAWVCPASSTYQVKINSSGLFSGWAWNDVVGWISFNCNQLETGDTCGTSNYKTQTVWNPTAEEGSLISSTFNTGVTSGAAFNYILWRGSRNSGSVSFQLAASNCANGATDLSTCVVNVGWGGTKVSGDGAFVGSDGTSSSRYSPADADIPAKISNINNKGYFRYKIFISTDAGRTASPTVTDVIVNWSP